MGTVMFRIIKSLLMLIKDRIQISRDPAAYAKAVGVHLGVNVNFYGMKRGMFGSEPWMISIGNNVYITGEVQFVTHDGGTLILRKEVPDLEWSAPITICNDVYIGFRTVILPGVTIGNRCIIGAGSVVSRSIPDNSVAAGVPAKVIKSTDDYLEQMKKKSLKCGYLKGAEKDKVLREIYKDWAQKA